MCEKLKDILTTVSLATFESLAFLFPVDDDVPEGESPGMLLCRVRFAGPFGGELLLAIEERMLPELTGNMLGTMDELGPECRDQQIDAVKELLNVICGNLLPEIAGPEPVFNVDAPQVASVAEIPASLGALPLAARAAFTLDTGRAEVALFLERAAVETIGSPA